MGATAPTHIKNDPKANLLLQVDTTDPDQCWRWQGRIGRGGYGYITTTENGDKRPRLVHRVSYRLLVGPIPDGLTLDHLCRVRSCVNPAHLEPVPIAVNIDRGFDLAPTNKRKTHCKRGHPFDEANTYWIPSGIGRSCRACIELRRLGQI